MSFHSILKVFCVVKTSKLWLSHDPLNLRWENVSSVVLNFVLFELETITCNMVTQIETNTFIWAKKCKNWVWFTSNRDYLWPIPPTLKRHTRTKKQKKTHAEKETEWWPFKCSGMKTTQLLCFKKLVNVDVAMIIIHVGSFILVHWVFREF